VPADRSKHHNSVWEELLHEQAICVLRKRWIFDLNGSTVKYHEVVINTLYIPFLVWHGFLFFSNAELKRLSGHDPTQLTEAEKNTYGCADFNFQFYREAEKAIWDRRNKALELCLLSNAPSELLPVLLSSLFHSWPVEGCNFARLRLRWLIIGVQLSQLSRYMADAFSFIILYIWLLQPWDLGPPID